MVCPDETKKNEFIRLDLKMKVVILAGGFGTRLEEETHLKPKPMIENRRQTNLVAYHDLFNQKMSWIRKMNCVDPP